MGLVESSFWGLCAAFTSIWFVTRIVSYFVWTEEQALADFTNTVLPPGTSPDVTKTFGTFIHEYFTWKQVSMRAHILEGVFLGVVMMWNLPAVLRRKSINLHRWLGRIGIPVGLVFCAHMYYMLQVHGMSAVGYWFKVNNYLSLVVLSVTLPLGWYYARAKKIRQHKICMVIAAAAMFVNATERFLWVIFAKVIQYGGPYTSWEVFRDTANEATGLGALIVNYVAAAYVISKPPAKPKAKTN